MRRLKKSFTACAVLVLSSTVMADETTRPDAQVGLMSSRTVSASQTSSSPTTTIQSLVDKGLSFLGIRYRFGGNGPENGGFDCSGLVKRVFGDAIGLNLPRTAADMAKQGEKISRDELKPGDLVFFNTMRRSFSHVGIYLGNNRFLHAPSTGKTVRVAEIDDDYWTKRFAGARRLISSANAGEPAVPTMSVSSATVSKQVQDLHPTAAELVLQYQLQQLQQPSDAKTGDVPFVQN